MKLWEKIVFLLVVVGVIVVVVYWIASLVGGVFAGIKTFFDDLYLQLQAYYSPENAADAITEAGQTTADLIGGFHEWMTTYVYTPVSTVCTDIINFFYGWIPGWSG